MEELKLTLKSDKVTEFNDEVYDLRTFELQNYAYNFSILPKTKYWRFGIRLSETKAIEFFQPSRRYKSPMPENTLEDVHIGVGDHEDKKWKNPNRLHFTQYYFDGKGEELKVHETYFEHSTVDWSIRFDDVRSVLVVMVKSGTFLYNTELPVKEKHKYFKVFAWADNIPYEIYCTITITDLLGKQSSKGKTVTEDSSSQSLVTEGERLSAMQSFMENFFQDFSSIITKNIKWYSETLDEEDARLGEAIAVAMEQAKGISEMSNSSLLQSSNGVTQAGTIEFKKFTANIQSVVSICEGLLAHYRTRLSSEQYQVDSVPLNEFLQMAEKYLTVLLKVEKTPYGDPLPDELLEIINKSNVGVTPTSDEETITIIKSDVPNADAEDSLDITPDVNALASVITYSKVTPPLAIGLFGNWGSGKSFFMKKLRKQIDVFAADEGTEYVNRVVHIEFNSWHYSDSNLWASFVTKIFEDLDSYGKKHPDAVKELFKKLNSASEFLTEANTKLEGIKATIGKLEEELEEKKTEISDKAKKLSGIKLTDVAKKVLSNDEVQLKLDEIKKQLPQRELNNLNDIYRSIKELDGFVNKLVETIKIVLSFKSWKSWVALALFIIICTSPLWLFQIFNVHISDFFNWFGKYSAPAAIILANLAGIASYATIGLNKVQEKLKSVAGDCAELEKEALAQHQSEVDQIQAELDVQKQAHIQKEAEINKLKKEQAEVQATIDDIQSGKKLANFIAGRVTDQRYVSSLGLISWIRKDFQKLDELLKEQRLLNKLAEMPKEEKERIFQIDRIILYIDDLDRCNEDVVVKVLEAIHLLLAFELFVVVVGVDPRWMHNALENKYSKQLKKHKDKKYAQSENENDIDNEIDSASSYDYLEKIFQIPLSLNEIKPAGKSKLIDETLKVIEQPPAEDENKKSTIGGVETKDKTNGEEKEVVDILLPQPELDSAEEEIKQQKEEQEKKEIEREVKRAKQRLVISPDEIKFMKSISALVGNTPRAVNRYINVYRILRSHSNFKVSDNPIQDYCAVMILLGVVTGLPNESEDFFRSLAKENSGTFENFVNKGGDEFKLLKDACKTTFKVPGLSEKAVGKLSIEFMKKKFELVQRFSFRPYDENETPVVVNPKITSVRSEKS